MSSSLSFAGLDRLRRIWLVGCGSMGGALLGRWLACGLAPQAITVIDPSPSGLPEGFPGKVAASPEEAAAAAPDPSLVVLAVKPQIFARLAPSLAPFLGGHALVLSMLAGVRITTLAGFFPERTILRMMPNTPARIGRGVTAVYRGTAAEDDAAAIERLLLAAGKVVFVEDEGRFDAVTAVSGSGPAFLFRFIEALEGAAGSVGLDDELAKQLALETIAGAAELARLSDLPVARLRQQVTSAGGTTEAGLDVLDGGGVLSSLLRQTVRAATERSRELALEVEQTVEQGGKA